MNFIDQTVLNFFANNMVDWLIFVMLVITYLGNFVMVGVLTFLSAISFYIHKHTARILPLFVSVGGSSITVYILKNIFDRARPIGGLYSELTSSFPSYHATAAIALYGFFLYTIWKYDKHYLKKPLIIFLLILIVSIGASRLYLGVHYLSDVLVGYVVGLIWLLLSIKLHKYILRFFGSIGSHKLKS
ncbi:MAG: phosphatase PAP2 family protein [Patescibacteria group bacterium]